MEPQNEPEFYSVKEFCICCKDQECFFDCPLCDNERYFEDEFEGNIDDFMIDFYRETILDPYFTIKTYEDKLAYLDEELEKYFS